MRQPWVLHPGLTAFMRETICWFPGASATWYPPWMQLGMIPISENGTLRTCQSCRSPSVMCWPPARRMPLKISVPLWFVPMWTPLSTPATLAGRESLSSGWCMKWQNVASRFSGSGFPPWRTVLSGRAFRTCVPARTMNPCTRVPFAARKRIGWWVSTPPGYSPYSITAP